MRPAGVQRWCAFLASALLVMMIAPVGVAEARSTSVNTDGTAVHEWPQYMAGPTHRGFNPAEHVLSPTTVGGLITVWLRTVPMPGIGVPDLAAAGGRVVLGPLGAMTAFDQLTGDLLWTKPESPNRFSQGVAISGDFVIGAYILRDATDARVLVTARRLSTGRLEWSRWYAAPNGSSASVAGPVTVRYGRVYVALNNGRVHALDVRTGAPIWSRHLPLAGDGQLSSPTVVDDLVLVSLDQVGVAALDASTGAVKWARRLEEGAGFSVLVGAITAGCCGTIYLQTPYRHTYAVNLRTGRVLWRANVGGGFSTPALANGTLYVNGEDQVSALNAQTGAVKWQIQLSARNSPAVANGVLYETDSFTAGPPRVLALDAATGAVLWQREMEAEVESAPIVSDGRLYVLTDAGQLTAFGLSTDGSTVDSALPQRRVPTPQAGTLTALPPMSGGSTQTRSPGTAP